MAVTMPITITEFLAMNRITMTAKPAATNPNMPGTNNMDHWRCTLRNGCGDRMIIPFSMGCGNNGRSPTAEDVLDCLASDSASIENARSFEDWAAQMGSDPDSRAAEMGSDPDSRDAEKSYRVCLKQADKLKAFLGLQYHILLWDIERL